MVLEKVSRDGTNETCLVGRFVVGVSDLRSWIPVTCWTPSVKSWTGGFSWGKAVIMQHPPGPAFFGCRTGFDCSWISNTAFNWLISGKGAQP